MLPNYNKKILKANANIKAPIFKNCQKLFLCFLLTIFGITFGINSNLLMAKQKAKNEILIILGKEEEILSRYNSQGANFYLNQALIDLLSPINDIGFKKTYIEEIKKDKFYAPSIMVLKTIMLNGQETFDLKEPRKKTIQIDLIKEVLNNSIHLFFNYLSQIQAVMPSSDCLNKEIPGLEALSLRFQYLESEEQYKFLIKERTNIIEIFEKLKQVDTIYTKCKQKKPEEKKKA